MSDQPAWSRDSMVLRLDRAAPLDAPTPEWAFAGSRGAGVRVAVIDSGIDAGHPALDGCVEVDSGVEVTIDDDGEIVIERGPHDDAFGHGTACAGIIHALAPEARITSVRVLGPGLTGKAAAFHAGLQWAVEQGFDVINLSLGTNRAEWALPFHEVCDRAYFSSSFVVTAANNVARASYPSLYASVASVACNTATDPLRYHGNPDPPTEFLARGIDVEVPWIGGSTNRATGNSYAAPHIAGLAALVKAKHPELRPFQIKAVLWAASANVQAAVASGQAVDSPEGAGRRSVLLSAGRTTTMIRSAPSVPAASPAAGATGAPPPAGAARDLATVRSQRRLGLNDELAVALAVSAELARLHRSGRVHGDVTARTVEVDDQGLVHLARARGTAPVGLQVATLRLLAPEQLRGVAAVPATDVHAVGLLLFEGLTGELPHPEASTAGDLLRRRLDAPGRRFASMAPDLPPELGALVDRLVALDPADRPADGAALGRELGAVARRCVGATAILTSHWVRAEDVAGWVGASDDA